MYNFLQKVQVMQYMVLAEGQVISPAILMDFLRKKGRFCIVSERIWKFQVGN